MLQVNDEGRIVAGDAVISVIYNNDFVPLSKYFTSEVLGIGEAKLLIQNTSRTPIFAEISMTATNQEVLHDDVSDQEPFLIPIRGSELIFLGLFSGMGTFTISVKLHFANTDPMSFNIELLLDN